MLDIFFEILLNLLDIGLQLVCKALAWCRAVTHGLRFCSRLRISFCLRFGHCISHEHVHLYMSDATGLVWGRTRFSRLFLNGSGGFHHVRNTIPVFWDVTSDIPTLGASGQYLDSLGVRGHVPDRRS